MLSLEEMSMSATAAAERTVASLTERYSGRVQIHLHASSSLPSRLVSWSGDDTWDDLPVALVWTVDSLRLLRSYGVIGSFTGTLAQFAQQNVFLGLPVQLMAEEVVFLVRRACAVVIDESESYRASSAQERNEVDAKVQEDRASQQLGAWYERQQLRAQHSSHPIEQEPQWQELQNQPWHYTIPSRSTFPWYTPTAYTKLSKLQRVFAFPRSRHEMERCALFDHMLTNGMWCMNGLRFGGSLAVYPGDPLRYHSHYTAQLIGQNNCISIMSLVANGRLGTSVKKTHLLCCVDETDRTLDDELRTRDLHPSHIPTPLQCILQGNFDTAQRAENDPTSAVEQDPDAKPSTFAHFNVFSLAWAGFGT